MPLEHICWVAEGKECALETCNQLAPIVVLMRLYGGQFGIQEAIQRDAEIQATFMAQVVKALTTIDKTPIQELIDGLPFAEFIAHYEIAIGDIDGGALVNMLEGLESVFKGWALKMALPDALSRAEQALEEISDAKPTPGELAELAKTRSKALRAHQQGRLRAELQRRILELQEAADRARRAAEVVRAARDSPGPIDEKVSSTSPPTESGLFTEAGYDGDTSRCREGAASNVMGPPSLRQTSADVYCLIVEARATPDVVSSEEAKRLTNLFRLLHEAVIDLDLEALRWPLADPREVENYLKRFPECPPLPSLEK